MLGCRTMRMICSSRFCDPVSSTLSRARGQRMTADLESLVLENPLDGCILIRGREFCLKDDTERSVSHNLALRVLEIPRLAGDSVLNLLADDFCGAD